MRHQSKYRSRFRVLLTVTIAAVCIWGISGHILWNVGRQACYQYVHHIKSERSFRDTLVLDIHTYRDAGKVVWVKQNEIRYAGRMFDIKKTFSNNKHITLVGHYDDFEHELYRSLQKLFGDDKEQPKQGIEPNWLAITAVLIEPYGFDKQIFNTASSSHRSQYNNFYRSISIPPLLAPPDNAAHIAG